MIQSAVARIAYFVFTSSLGRIVLVSLLTITMGVAATAVTAQEAPPRLVQPGGRPPGAEAAETRARAEKARQQGNGEKKEGEKKDGEKPEGEDEKKDGEEGEQKEEKEDSVKRPKTPPRVPDPREFDAKLDDNELIRFAFHGQPWPEVLQWLATLSGYSLDWQELPSDYINVTTNRAYSLAEVQDLFNRLLFERGYTMARKGQILLVAKIDKLDPSLLPRIDESQLMDLPAHDFVKITFQLPDRLKANEVAEDVKAILSRHAKVQPLMATNRLLIVGLVANLREASQLINAEHAAATSDVRPREFVIRYARADHVADQVMILLGLDPSSRRTPQELQLETQRLQLFNQMQQRGKDVSKFMRKGDAPTVFLAVNYRQNSIVANAPPEQMKIIERTVQMLDTPTGMSQSLTSNASQPELRKYKLTTLKTEALVSALEEIADLDPRTRLKTDADARILFASATAQDHQKIQSIIDDMDGTGRSFEVVWLRRLPADAVAVTVQKLMVGEEEKDDNRRSYGYFSYRRGREEKEENPNKGFRVDADIENNRLLLWANESELEEVRNFLVKLGEIPGEDGNPNTVRVLKARDQESTRRLIEQLRSAWPAVGPNELRIDAPSTPSTSPDADDSAVLPAKSAASTDAETKFANRLETSATDDLLAVVNPVGAQVDDSRQAPPRRSPASQATNRNTTKPPVTISLSEDGRVIISSADTQALDLMEELLARIAPAPKDYEVFYLRNALASLVTLNLEEYFEETESKDNSQDFFWGWYDFDSSQDDDSPTGLSKRREIRFIYDYDTNSILVSNATPEQLEVVRDLVKIYDEPASEDSISARRFQMFKVKFAQAEDVAKTIKDVYRDLLSSKDKVFDSNRGEKEQSSQTTNYYRVYGNDEDKKPKKIKASFAGAISVGVDPVSNTVIVSAQEEWMSSIGEMIKYLDREAAPYSPTVKVVNSKVNVEALQAALSRALGTDSSKVQIKESTPEPKPGQGEERVASQKSKENDS